MGIDKGFQKRSRCNNVEIRKEFVKKPEIGDGSRAGLNLIDKYENPAGPPSEPRASDLSFLPRRIVFLRYPF